MRLGALAIIGLLGLGAPAMMAQTNIYNRDITSLNGEWHYLIDVQEEGYYDYRMNPSPWGFFLNAKPQQPQDLVEYSFDSAPTMHIPGDWNTQDDKLFFYEGTVWFQRYFTWQPKVDKRTLLYFGAVNYDAHVYVNGHPAGHHEGGFTPFSFDVTDLLKEGENFVVVKADNKRRPENIPTQIFDWWNYGGITRDVFLVSVNPVYIRDYSVRLDKAGRQLEDMISRDINRANIIIWSIANETPHSPERDAFLGRLATHARSLDDTRLISMAMEVTSADNYVNRLQDNMHVYVDVVSFNQYVGWYRDVNDARKMTWEIPYDKPVIVSEFGGGAKYGLHGPVNQRWTEEFQENLYRENLQMLDKIDGLAGTTPWILKDFRSPRRILDGIQDYYNRKGLMSEKGEKKKAFYILRDWYKQK